MLRVSNMLMAKNMRNYIQNNLQRSAKSQEQISTGKTINRASDNPSEISHLMAINATLVKNDQYDSNIVDGLAYLDQSDSALNTIGTMIQDAKTLSLEGANGTLTQSDMNAIAEQIDRQIDAMVDLSNSALGGKYLFAGRKNGQPPFYRDPQTGDIYYRGDTNLITREITFGYSYEVVAAGVTDNQLKGSVDLSEGKTLTANDMKFKIQLEDGNVQEIDLSLVSGFSPGFHNFSEIKTAMQDAINTAFPPDATATPQEQITVSDDGKGHIILKSNTDASAFKLFAADSTSQGHVTLFGGDRSVAEGVFGKLASPDNPANQIDDPMNPGEKMTKVVGGPFEILRNLAANLRSGDSDAIQDSLGQLDVAHDEVLKHRVGVGARTRHLESVQDQLADQEVKLKSTLTYVQGADITALTIEVAQNQLVYQASLMTASNLLKTTLLNYLS